MKIFPINKFIIYFIICYLIISFLGNFFLDYLTLNFLALLIFISFYFYLYIGASFGLLMPKIKRYSIIFNLNLVIYFFLIIITVTTILSWKCLIRKFGSLGFILLNSSEIRANTIGKDDGTIPVILTYINSIVYSIFIMCLVLFKKNYQKKYILLTVYSFILIFINDLLYFGRVGLIFSMFCFLGYFFYYNIKFKIKYIILIIILVIIISLPRLIRGNFDNFTATVSDITPHYKIDIPPYYNFAVSYYIYYFSPIYAFSETLINNDLKPTYGSKTFTPVYNFINRFIIKNDRISLIDEYAYIPFRYNIYSIVKDLYTDFGYLGIFLFALIMGIFIGFSFKNRFHTLNIFLFSWFFYTPIYNLISFG